MVALEDEHVGRPARLERAELVAEPGDLGGVGGDHADQLLVDGVSVLALARERPPRDLELGEQALAAARQPVGAEPDGSPSSSAFAAAVVSP